MSESPVTLFIPFGEGYGKPGLTLRGDSVKEIDAELRLLTDSVDEEPALLDSLLSSVETVKAAMLLKFPQEEKKTTYRNTNAAPVAASAPTGDIPKCTHGFMKYKEGKNRTSGKDYKGYFCPAPQGAPGGQCSPVWL